MENVPYEPGRCMTYWFRLVQSRYLKWPLSAGIRVERLDTTPRADGGTLTFPREIKWPATRAPREDDVFEITAAIPVPIISHEQVLFVSLRDVYDRVVARVHITYTDARTLRRGGFRQWYPAEPAPEMEGYENADPPEQITLNALAKYERTTFRLVHFLDDGDLYPHALEPPMEMHPTRTLVSNEIDLECLHWASSVSPDEPSQLLLAGAFHLPVQAILFDLDEETTETAKRTRRDVENGKYLASILLHDSPENEHDKLFVACEYASGNMCAIDVPSLADDDDYTRLAFPDASCSIYRTATDKVGALVAVLRRLDLSGWHPAIVMTLDSKGRRCIEAGMVKMTYVVETVVILSNRRCSVILLVAWRLLSTCVEIVTRWRANWTKQSVSTHSEVWTLTRSSIATSPHLYRCDHEKWTRIFLPALLSTTPRRLSPHLLSEAINEIAQAVSSRRTRGETGGYIPLGYDIDRIPIKARVVGIQRGFVDAVVPGLSAARQVRNQRTRYTAFW